MILPGNIIGPAIHAAFCAAVADAPTILKALAAGNYDVMVMGSHGHSRVHRALLGSVSERVLHKAAVPVLMLRSHCEA